METTDLASWSMRNGLHGSDLKRRLSGSREFITGHNSALQFATPNVEFVSSGLQEDYERSVAMLSGSWMAAFKDATSDRALKLLMQKSPHDFQERAVDRSQ